MVWRLDPLKRLRSLLVVRLSLTVGVRRQLQQIPRILEIPGATGEATKTDGAVAQVSNSELSLLAHGGQQFIELDQPGRIIRGHCRSHHPHRLRMTSKADQETMLLIAREHLKQVEKASRVVVPFSRSCPHQRRPHRAGRVYRGRIMRRRKSSIFAASSGGSAVTRFSIGGALVATSTKSSRV
jgi:hypothetical protein